MAGDPVVAPAPHPTPAVLGWVRAQLGTGAVVSADSTLLSVSSTTLHSLDATGPDGTAYPLVLRRFHDARRLADDPWYRPANEAAVLQLLQGADVAAPRMLASDLTGADVGMPTLLTDRLPGRACWEPAELPAVIRGLAAELVKVHSVDAAQVEGLAQYSPYYDPARDGDRTVPAWSARPRMWEEAFTAIEGIEPSVDAGFIHRDYHPGQALWMDGRLTGVVDWTTGCWGPLAIDLARARLNLARDFGPGCADQFLASYVAVSGRDPHHPYWDLVDLADYLLDSNPPESVAEQEAWDRLEAWLEQVCGEL